jgi:inner membrane protein
VIAFRYNIRYCELMANAREHTVAGLVAGTAAYFLWKSAVGEQFQFGHLLLAACTGAGAGLFADLVEPALHSHHRKFFHSVAFGTVGSLAVTNVWNDGNTSQMLLLMSLAAGCGHGSHLLLDAITPRGLPLI